MKTKHFSEVSKQLLDEIDASIGCESRLLFVHTSVNNLSNEIPKELLRELSEKMVIVGCSTAGGEICGNEIVGSGRTIGIMVEFEKSTVEVTSVLIRNIEESHAVGREIAETVRYGDDLRHIYIIAPGNGLNVSELCLGINEVVSDSVNVSGGLAGNDKISGPTLTMHNEQANADLLVAIAFYGNDLKIGTGSFGGWDPFGPERIITKSEQNVVYSMDREPALALYRKYLGEYADQLPDSGLLFPLCIKKSGSQDPLIRTLVSINDEDGSVSYAGDVPQGVSARLMCTNIDRIIFGSKTAAEHAVENGGFDDPDLVLMVSCVGRKLVLGPRVEEELEAVTEVFGPDRCMTGFYSYGEIGPTPNGVGCDLHNQSITITTLKEI